MEEENKNLDEILTIKRRNLYDYAIRCQHRAVEEFMKIVVPRAAKNLGISEGELISAMMGQDRLDQVLNIYNNLNKN